MAARPDRTPPSGTSAGEGRPVSRLRLARDLIVFQAKLVVDGLRDVLLAPIAFLAALIDVLGRPSRGGVFYGLLRFGRQTDRWIDLFAAGREDDEDHAGDRLGLIDEAVDRLEEVVLEQYRRGELTSTARDLLGRATDQLQRYVEGAPPSAGGRGGGESSGPQPTERGAEDGDAAGAARAAPPRRGQ